MVKEIRKYHWKNLLKMGFRLLIPILFFFYVFQIIKPKDAVLALWRTEWFWFLLGSLSIFVVYILCSVRTRKLLYKNELSLARLWAVHALSALIAGLLPFRSGELSFVYYLRKYCVVPASEGTAILVSVRFVEYLIFLVLIFVLSFIGILISPSSLNWIVFSIIGTNLILILLVLWNANFFLKPLKSISRSGIGFLLRESTAKALIQKATYFSSHVKTIFSDNLSIKLLLITVIIVLLRQAFVLLMLRSMGFPITLRLVILLFAFLYAVKFIQGFGSFGSQEAGVTAALILTGRSQVEALPIAIGMHLLQWAPILLFGCVAHLLLHFGYNLNTQESAAKKY